MLLLDRGEGGEIITLNDATSYWNVKFHFSYTSSNSAPPILSSHHIKIQLEVLCIIVICESGMMLENSDPIRFLVFAKCSL